MRQIEYEKNIWNNVSKFIKPTDLIFDVGANIGQYSLRFSEIVSNSGKIIAIEPDSKNHTYLVFNLGLNYCNNVEALKVGLSNKMGNSLFYRDVNNGGRLGSFIKSNNLTVSENVEITTLDSLTRIYGVPDFIKIDVEGFEVSVVQGLSNFNRKTKYLIEVRQSTKGDIFELFHNQGFNCYLVDGLNLEKIEKSEDIPKFGDLFFIYE
jgi:FkbM family methyltransferase